MEMAPVPSRWGCLDYPQFGPTRGALDVLLDLTTILLESQFTGIAFD